MYFFDDRTMIHPYRLGFFHDSQQHQNPHLDLCHGNSMAVIRNSFSSGSNRQKSLLPVISESPNDIAEEYDLVGEGDLFKAPQSIIDEPVLELDPMSAVLSIMSNGGDLIVEEPLKATDAEFTGNSQLLSEFYYECQKDILAKSAPGDPFFETPDVKIPTEKIEEENDLNKERLLSFAPIQKTFSSISQNSADYKGSSLRPNFLDFEEMGLGAALGIRRAHSDGDIKTLGNSNSRSLVTPCSFQPTSYENLGAVRKITEEERKEKLSRYRMKRERRSFNRKIKYACRKALADNQLRVRGRFAKIEERKVMKSSN